MKRRQLGVYSKAPIDKLKDSILGKFFGIASGAIAFGITWAFTDFVINTLNFLEDNMQDGTQIGSEDTTTLAIKGVVSGAVALFVFTRKA